MSEKIKSEENEPELQIYDNPESTSFSTAN